MMFLPNNLFDAIILPGEHVCAPRTTRITSHRMDLHGVRRPGSTEAARAPPLCAETGLPDAVSQTRRSPVTSVRPRSSVWTCTPVAEVSVQLRFARNDIFLRLDATPFVVPDLVPARQVFVLAAGCHTMTGDGSYQIPVQRYIIAGGLVHIVLVIPTAISSHDLGISEDRCELGLRLFSMTFKVVA
jgi:hypothetical protein